ncbi:oligosaccharide flippase family protein, partial [Singulisphaera rosea]
GVGVARIANYIAHSGGNFVVGRWLGPGPLGLFLRAYQLMTLPIFHLANALSTVLFPAYSKLQGDPKRMATVYMSSVTLTALVLFPILTVIGIVAPELVRGLFGAKWAGAIIPLQILCGAGWLRTMTNLGDTVARAQGLVYKQALRHCIYAINVLLGAFLTYRWGINGVSVGVFVAVVIHYVLISHLAVIASGVPWKDYLSCQLPGVVMAAVISLATAPVTVGLRTTGLPDLLILAVTIATAAISGIAAGILLPGHWLGEVPKEAIRMLQRKLGGRVRFFHLDP